MKKTDLEKNKALKLANSLKASATPARFGAASGMPDRREQRKLDQAAGLLSYPVKLHKDTIQAVRARAAQEGIAEHVLVNRLLDEALAQS